LIREDLSTLCSFQGASESRHIYLKRYVIQKASARETKFIL